MSEAIEKLKSQLSDYNTESLLGMICLNFISTTDTFGNIGNMLSQSIKTGLTAPQNQLIYLAGLLMSTDEKESLKSVDKDDFIDIAEQIQSITFNYVAGFKIDSNSAGNLEKIKKNAVSMEAFLSYFDTGLLIYDDQIEELTKTLYIPFDDELLELTGLRIEDYLGFYHFVYDSMQDVMNEMAAARELVFKGEMSGTKSITQSGYKKMFDALKRQNRISITSVENKFGIDKAHLLINTFSIKRKHRDFLYYNGKNPFSSNPLCWINESTLFVVSPLLLLNAIYNKISSVVEDQKNSFSSKFTKIKGNYVEEAFEKCLIAVLGQDAIIHKSVCERVGTQEHDLLIEYEDYILIAEAKGSKVKEPFFNPEKAFPRIKQHFFSDKGIGGAYQQACLLMDCIKEKNEITLYENMKEPFKLTDIQRKKIIPMVLTLNQFGTLSLNTSLLITPDDDKGYPWVCSLPDFQNLIKMMSYLGKTSDDFIQYICWRCNNHAHIHAGDELDIAEYFFTTSKEKRIDGPVFIDNSGKDDLIDKIYFKEKGAEINISESRFSESKPIRAKRKIYPNEKCPCGSGKKFKQCHKGKGLYD